MLQAFVNVSVVSGFCPTTGVTAPFLSYGGSSMISCLISVGLILSVSRVAERDALSTGEESQEQEPQRNKRLTLHCEQGD
jgi:cell division protein FtsW